MGDEELSKRTVLIALLRQMPSESDWARVANRLAEGSDLFALLQERVGPASLLDDPVDAALSAAAAELRQWETEDIGVVGLTDGGYPRRLRDAFDCPPLLFTRGMLDPDDIGVAVVGSRQPSPAALTEADTLARRLVDHGISVVAGLAAGIDTAAHEAALDSEGRTVAVIGTGIREHYPPENASLHQQVADRGLLLSQFWPDTRPGKTTFPRRNGTMSGYSAATVIVEASERSGTRIQARKAVEHGRPVVLMRRVVETTDWGRERRSDPDVHVASGVDEAMEIIDEILNRPTQIDRLLASATAG